MIKSFLNNFVNSKTLLRPPGAVDEEEFAKRCIRCRKCELACTYKSIKPAGVSCGDKIGTPVIVARDVPCYVCMKCVDVCPTGAIEKVEKQEINMGKAKLDTNLCLAYNGIICRACFERCPMYREAITLRDEVYPEVHEDKCIGCGICEQVCLTDTPAIVVNSRHQI